MPTKLLVIGYDGGTLDIIEPLLKKGRLPIFAKLIQNGVYGKLQSVYPPVSAPAWVSFMTGKNPGKHSVFNFTSKTYGTYSVEPAVSTSIDSITLFECLSLEKKRVAVLNVPLTYPPKKVNGICVSGLGTPDEESDFIYPSAFAEELKSAVPGYRIDVGWARYGDKSLGAFINDLSNLTEKTYEAAKYCLGKEDWDVFMVVFIGPDRIQHRLWNSISPHATNINKNQEARNRADNVQKYFSFLDRLIGNLIDESADEPNVIVLSDHGFGPFVKDFDLNNWLASEALLTYSSEALTTTEKMLKGAKRLARTFGISKKWILEKLDGRIDVYKYLEKSSPMISRIDWAKTKAFCYSSHFIYINLKGRERHGVVNAGVEYENLRDVIISKLYSLKDPDTDHQVVRKVQRIEDVYHGHNLKRAPDLIITEYDEAGYVGADRIFQNEKDDKIFMKTADTQEGVHRQDGFFIASGRDTKKGHRIEGANIIDLFPTILFWLGLTIPNDVDGEVLTNIFEETLREPYFEKKDDVKSETYCLSEDEKDKMIERLKNLGYL